MSESAIHFETLRRERGRVRDIQLKAALPGHGSLLAALIADGKSTGEDAARAVVAAERAKRGIR